MKSTASNTRQNNTVTHDRLVKSFTPDQATQKTGASKAKPAKAKVVKAKAVKELGGRKQGLEPTRYGDWEKAGRCIDF